MRRMRPTPLHSIRPEPDGFRVGDRVRIKTMGRTDAVGFVRSVGTKVCVRLEYWQADGSHLDATCDHFELERA